MNISISREYIGLPITNSAEGYFEIEYQGNISASFDYTGNISGYKQLFYTNSAVGIFQIEYHGNISAFFEYTGNILEYRQIFYTNSAVH